mmetsp:Transcript_16692/g.32408  ORF Transcript_16692/g.32408 Transcript_16692/m.32408 type:complete len:335 (+) Transcript_16692:61-1065(+)|eukprot:CAMPEP_0171580004 /NCGR_PEP_ID=MMETSP0961-20121227/8802_1 /TAXON_ID=87120 /ORGANISM="Aurantiochytrium limacinum, Strain ATCCMYA-1381" /LENGTH=334 /DNA_ID=CAMNT_0012136643 /DNA_START=22 /DNA_END=1026 /DNA_ORIENTATION=-
MASDYYTLEQLALEDSASEYSSDGEDTGFRIMGELTQAMAQSGIYDGKNLSESCEPNSQRGPQRLEETGLGGNQNSSRGKATSHAQDIDFLRNFMRPKHANEQVGMTTAWRPDQDLFVTKTEKKNAIISNVNLPSWDVSTIETGDNDKARAKQCSPTPAKVNTSKTTWTRRANKDALEEALRAERDQEEDVFHDEDEDERNRNYVNKKYRTGEYDSDALLSCPGCFSTVAFDSKQSRSHRGWYIASKAFNCKERTSAEESPEEIIIECSQCSTALGIRLEDGSYEFQVTLPSAADNSLERNDEEPRIDHVESVLRHGIDNKSTPDEADGNETAM